MRRFFASVGVGTGSLLCLLAVVSVIVISVCMNGYFFFMRLGGDTTFLVGGSISVVAAATAVVVAGLDVLKAFAPLFFARAWQHKNYGYMLVAIFFLVGGVSLSLLASYGIILEQRSGLKTERTAKVETKTELELQLNDTRSRLNALGFVRPEATIKAELAAQRQNRRWQSSQQCTDATASLSRDFCATYNELKAELGKATAIAAERQRLAAIAGKLQAIRSQGGVKAADPQMEGLAKVTGWDATSIETSWLLLIAVMIEGVSAFGLYFALGHGPKPSPAVSRGVATPSRPLTTNKDLSRPAAVREAPAVTLIANETSRHVVGQTKDAARALIVNYGSVCLRKDAEEAVEIVRVYADFEAWCRGQGHEPVSRSVFTQTLIDLAEQVADIEVRTVSRKKMLVGMQLIDQAEAA